jgi:16S rRNA (guanine966-N2)-methyltransferase
VLRVIAGSLKGRKLMTPTWTGLRPTSDKLRETLFNVISPRMAGARVLDGYAGTGAIGIEALSRGAEHVTFVETDTRAVGLIEENLRRCGVSDRYAIIRTRVAPGLTGSFDLAVLDPPYEEPDLSSPVAAVTPAMAPRGLIVLEHARRRVPPEAPPGLQRTRTLVSGDSALTFYEKVAP